jgi:hypothetical protein
VKVINIVGNGAPASWIISSASFAEFTSDPFGNLPANKSYDFTIVLTGSVSKIGFAACYMGSNVVGTAIGGGSGVTTAFDTSYSYGKFTTPSHANSFRFNFVHHGTIFTGTNGANLTASVIDGDGCSGNSLSGADLVVTGKAYIQLVGSVA